MARKKRKSGTSSLESAGEDNDDSEKEEEVFENELHNQVTFLFHLSFQYFFLFVVRINSE